MKKKHLICAVIVGLFLPGIVLPSGAAAVEPSAVESVAEVELPASVVWFVEAIQRLPSDEPVAKGTQGYNNYQTQKDHWLGWLDPRLSRGTYPRKNVATSEASEIYNRIVEPKMLLWLIPAAGVSADLVAAMNQAASEHTRLASKSAAIRRIVPWEVLEAALLARESQE